MQVKGPTEVNFQHGGGDKILHSQTHPLLSHFQNNSMLLELKTGGRKEVGKGIEADAH